MAGNAGYSPRLFSLLSDHIIDDGGVNIVKLYNTSYTTRSVKPVFIAINDDSLHHIKLFGYRIYSVTSMPTIAVSISCNILHQLLSRFMTATALAVWPCNRFIKGN
jgi:hypothetical protein